MKNIKKLKNITLFFALATASIACTTTVEETAPASFITAETIKASYAPYKIVTRANVSEISKSQVADPVAGENQMWDFTALSYDKDMTVMIEPPTTNSTFKGASFATITPQRFSTLNYDATNHYTIKNDGVYQLGYTSDAATSNVRTAADENIVVSKFAEDVIMSEPVQLMKFPFNYNDNFIANSVTSTDNYMANSTTTGNAMVKTVTTLTSNVRALASGTLKLKNGTFDVLVVRRNMVERRSYSMNNVVGAGNLNLLQLRSNVSQGSRYEFFTKEKLVFVIDTYDGVRTMYSVR
jgi:hypothetical protein